jgi:hypothetical protein
MATDPAQVNADPAATAAPSAAAGPSGGAARPSPLPGTNLVQVRARVDGLAAAPGDATVWIQQINLHAAFEPRVDAAHAHLPRDVPRSAGCWAAPWPWEARAAAAYQLVQPGAWGPGTEVLAGAQQLGIELVLEWQGSDGAPHTATVSTLADGSAALALDWQAPRDITLDVSVVDVDGEPRLAVTRV